MQALHAYGEAIRLLGDAVGEDCAPELHVNMGSLYYALGQHAQARQCFERALTIIDDDIARGGSEYKPIRVSS